MPKDPRKLLLGPEVVYFTYLCFALGKQPFQVWSGKSVVPFLEISDRCALELVFQAPESWSCTFLPSSAWWRRIGSLKLTMMGEVTPWELANPTNQCSFHRTRPHLPAIPPNEWTSLCLGNSKSPSLLGYSEDIDKACKAYGIVCMFIYLNK